MKRSCLYHQCLSSLALVSVALWIAAGTKVDGNPPPGPTPENQAEEQAARGNYDAAVTLWRSALADAVGKNDVHRQLADAVGVAQALGELGQNRLAEEALEKADGLAKTATDLRMQAQIESSLGTLYMYSTNPVDAEGLLIKSVALARQEKDEPLTATTLNNLANFNVCQGKNEEAFAEYSEGISLAQKNGDETLVVKILANLLTSTLNAGEFDLAKACALKIIVKEKDLPDSHEKAEAFLTAGKACVDIFTQTQPDDDDLRLKAYDAYQQAEAIALRLNDARALSYALGYEGELYEMEGRPSEALELTRHAAALVLQIKSSDVLFRWQWQIARILALQHQFEPAISAYQSAVATLQTVRHDLSLHYGNINYHSSFREAAGAVYYELADLLLQRADQAGTDADAQTDLLAARDTVEELKAAELEDYFQDDCANLLKAKVAKIETISTTAAVIYIIPLADRTEILVGMPSGRIERVKSPVTSAQIEETATAFRFNLENRTTDEYLEQATQMYDWLIKPLLPLIDHQKIDTLVFVPDGALRTIPMAALSDGEHFLVEKYAIATTPGLTLMEPKPLGQVRHNLIINGLSDGVQGFPGLPYVPEEVKKINDLYGGPEYLNGQFNKPNIQKEFSADNYSIVHIASHGHFDSDASKSYVLTYDGKLSLDDIERLIRPSQLRDQPVEMLTLSACQTAAGDDRAALGLAGIAVKAGARSAFATLWCVNDETSSVLVGDFYTNLHNQAGISKAQALQLAQIKLLTDPHYRHPCYWAPYLIIGNWL
jgi:CHAT domain-containing protein